MAKQATTRIFLDRYHPKADGKCAVSIRVTFNRMKRYYPTQYKLSEEDFEKLFSPKPREAYKNMLQVLVAEEKRANDVIDSLQGKFSFPLFEKRFCRKAGDQESAFAMLEARSNDLEREGRISSSVMATYALKSLQKFHSKGRLGFDEIDTDFLNRYRKWMENEGNSSATIGMYLREVRTVFNEAIAEGVISHQLYPFGNGKNKFKIPTGKNIKKALTLADISAIYNYEPETEGEEKGRDFWLLSYLGNGINVKDMALLKFVNIDGDVIRFERAKTKRANQEKPILITIIITPDIKRIINRWGNKSLRDQDYIFPILNSSAGPKEQYKLIQLFTAYINNNMRRIAAKLEIEATITTYVARHSFSTILKNSGTSIEAIGEALGHRNIKTTQNYLAGFEDEAKRKMVSQLTDFIKLKVV